MSECAVLWVALAVMTGCALVALYICGVVIRRNDYLIRKYILKE